MITRREHGWIGFTWDLLSFSTESDQDPLLPCKIQLKT